MNTKFAKFMLAVVLVFSFLGSFSLAKADTPADILDSYKIQVAPQNDGTLLMNYTLQNYCTYSDWPSDQPYLQIGVPNSSFEITDWGPKDGANKIIKAEQITTGGSFVQLDFDQNNLPKNGDCFDLNFSIVQKKMAYPDDNNNQITFKFIPAGWQFPIKVNSLTIIWGKPSDMSLLKVTDPSPASQDDANMYWQWNSPAMSSTYMFSDYAVKFAYDKSSFTLTDDATTSSDTGNGGDESGGGIILIIFVVILAIVLIVVIVGALTGSLGGGDDDYSGSGGIFFGGGSSSGHSGGGGLGGSGGGYSCACASCACACACAGGGKVGCSRKGIGVRCLPHVLKEIKEEHEDKTNC